MDALTALVTKRDRRSYQQRPVEADVLTRLLGAARMAGSAKNLQPIRVITVTDPDAKAALTAGGDFAARIDQPPVLAVFTVRSDAGPRRLFDVGRHAQNLMVAANALGLASCPVTFHHQDVVRSVLGIPDDVEAPIVVSLGWPDSRQVPSPIDGARVPLDTYAMAERWRA
ncbi:MAG: nitroreductase family protein [Acidimicrobiia bacterium]|nr:nitroreductase family protein [Acidimicrobiia bacterium]